MFPFIKGKITKDSGNLDKRKLTFIYEIKYFYPNKIALKKNHVNFLPEAQNLKNCQIILVLKINTILMQHFRNSILIQEF